MLKIGLPKGNMLSNSLKTIEELLNIEIDKKTRKLSYKNDEIEFFLLKHKDIPNLINNNIIDFGITSQEWITEKQLDDKLNTIEYLEWCNTRISLININGHRINREKKIKCITEFPFIASNFFENENLSYDIYHISGSSEALVGSGFDCCIDCVESGKTLKENNLYEEKIILNSKMVIVDKKREKIYNKYDKIIDIIKNIN